MPLHIHLNLPLWFLALPFLVLVPLLVPTVFYPKTWSSALFDRLGWGRKWGALGTKDEFKRALHRAKATKQKCMAPERTSLKIQAGNREPHL
jgi:hypothetical protein